MSTLEMATTGGTKVDRYNWTVKDTAGRFMMLDKGILQIDHEYQRDAGRFEKKIIDIAREWSWVACNTIAVAFRNGSYYVIDGQFRTLAARRRADIQQLPCLVFLTESVREEAVAFLSINTRRKPITAVDQFKAKNVTEDPVAMEATRLVELSGRVVGSSSNSSTVGCIAILQRLVRTDLEILKRVWPLIVRVCSGFPLHGNIVEGLVYIEKRMEDGSSLSNREWAARVMKIGYERLISGAARATAYKGNGGAAVWADGMVEELNRGCRNRLELRK